MTIIEPNKRKKALKRVVISFGPLIAVVLSGVIASIWLYSDIVELRHSIEEGEAELAELTVENADLKNRFYGLIDADALSLAAEEGGLVLEKRPAYLGASQEELAVSR